MEKVIVIPHGCGIGDFVNLQPLVRAVISARRHAEITVLGPPSLALLLPEAAHVLPRVAGIQYWQRPSPQTVPTFLRTFASSQTLGPLARILPTAAIAGGLTWYLEKIGYDEVINLLHYFMRLDLDDRWTKGPWTIHAEHVVDLLAGELEKRGIYIPLEYRVPMLRDPGSSVSPGPDVLLNVDAGNTLKTMPHRKWLQLVQHLSGYGFRVGVLQGPGNASATHLKYAAPTVEVVESPNLSAMLRAVKSARVLVSPDTGVLHVASALGVPFVGLFGPTDAQFLGPYSCSNGVVLTSPVDHENTCRRCWAAQLLPVAACGMDYPSGCMSAFNPSDVARVVKTLLEASRTR